MLIIYRKADGLIASNSGTNSYLPDGPPFAAEVQNALRKYGGAPEDYGEFRLNDNEDRELVGQILNAGSYELQFDTNGEPIGVTVYPRLTLTADKQQVTADGLDKVTVIATIADVQDTDPVTFEIEGVGPFEVVPENGDASVSMSFEPGNEGSHTITARHSKYGVNYVTLEVVLA
jgi:hypothetical protein